MMFERTVRCAALWVAAVAFLGCDNGATGTGKAGEGCRARTDCSAGLACIQQVCVEDGTGASVGRAGESCRAASDCGADLACVRNVCVPDDLGLSATGKSCYLVECAKDADCCADFVPDPNCDFYDMTCEADPSQCLAFFSLCQCNNACVEESCEAQDPGCLVDEHCVSASAPFCVNEQCVECTEHADCGGATDRCVEGQCARGCENDEECPLLEGCVSGSCEPVGCGSDRECVFLYGDSRARCVAGACSVACSSSFECDQDSHEVCHEGACVFAGCKKDAECRAALGVENESSARAVCR